jgi:FtsP/CotA-like multicopper oxidase with cupredoxin domain
LEAPVINEVMEFRGGGATVTNDVSLPAPLDTSGAPKRYFEFEDEYDPNIGNSMWHVTGPTRHDTELEVPTPTVANGSVEVWNWVHKTEMIHPMHIHLVQFQVLGRWQLGEGQPAWPRA